MADSRPLLARWRVTLGFVFGALVLWLAEPTARTIAIGVPVAVVGEALRLWASGHLNKSREVTSSGPYRWFAHPLYVGSSVMGGGLALAAGNVVVAALIAVYLAATLTAAIRSEEAFLRQKFGARYDEYRRGQSASGVGDDRRPFQWSQAMANREHRAIIGLVLVMLALIAKVVLYQNGAAVP